ncbi:hypothetical protein B0I18_11398 [Taibaiella chishuiensis]|uniref:Uncharacterized protein n=1 Tax=Taibaiella chishuiensis TaxID=1434707 RepID=A0A2P8CVW7_9BACT|nr:hypothetical protein B0I18_11398 [Taibaiella chishuiensis]
MCWSGSKWRYKNRAISAVYEKNSSWVSCYFFIRFIDDQESNFCRSRNSNWELDNASLSFICVIFFFSR